MTDNAELIAEARDFVQMGSGINVVEADRLIEELSRELEAADQRAAELAAVIEQAEDYVTRHYFDTQMGTNVLTMLVGDDPAEALREMKADVWDEGADAASKGYDLPDAAQIHNPYREATAFCEDCDLEHSLDGDGEFIDCDAEANREYLAANADYYRDTF